MTSPEKPMVVVLWREERDDERLNRVAKILHRILDSANTPDEGGHDAESSDLRESVVSSAAR